MTLKLNSSYKTATGMIIPRSHLSEEGGEKYCIVEVLTFDKGRYTVEHHALTTGEIRKRLGLKKTERIMIE